MNLTVFCKWAVILGTLAIWTIKWVLRPFFHFGQPLKYILGVAPNLLGAFLLPLGCYWLLRKWIDLFSPVQFKLFAVLCFVLLVINECLQLIPFFGRTFDLGDIAASAIGLAGSYLFCTRFLFRKLATYP